jgi:hypothetical protein
VKGGQDERVHYSGRDGRSRLAFFWVTTFAVAGPSAVAHCKGLPGKPWKNLYGKTGTTYDATVTGVTCAFAKPYVAKLLGPHHTQFKGGPAGWQCVSQGGGVPLDFRCTQGSPPKSKVIYGTPSGGANSG